MTFKPSRKKYLRFLNFILATVGIILGFSNSVVAQYGAPPNFFKINGKVISDECEYAIPNIKVTLDFIDSKYNQDVETYTDENGNYTFVVSEYMLGKYNLKAEDIDGQINGEYYQPHDKIKKNELPEKVGYGYNGYYNIPVDIRMKSLGVPPCEQEQNDTSSIPYEEQLVKTDVPNSIENIVDALTSNEILVYPNPNKGRFTVKFSVEQGTNVEFRLYDSNGKLILSKKIESANSLVEKNFNIEQMPVGLYFLNIIINDTMHTKKIVVN